MDEERRLRDLLVAHGLRVTRHRLTLLAELGGRDRPVTHPWLTARLPEMDRATVYRNLQVLTRHGVLVRTLVDRVWRYRLPSRATGGDHGRHPHFVCEDCGRVLCLDAADVVLRRRHAFRVSQVQLRGTCGGCLDGSEGPRAEPGSVA